MNAQTGDNLVAARQFAHHCSDTLRFLLTNDERETHSSIQLLSALRLEAQTMRARSIAQTANTAITEIGSGVPRARCDGTLLVLNKLVRQYRDGLDEIAPAAAELQDQSRQNDTVLPEALEAARETLIPLAKFARPGAEAKAIKALLNIVPFMTAQMPDKPTDSFEVIMPAITNESLRTARREKKSVSVSYACDDIHMDEGLAQELEAALITICQNLVNRTVEAPLRRQNQGLSGAAHIAITAREKAGRFNILVSCEGPVPSQNLLSEPEISVLKTHGASVSLSGHDMLTRIDIQGLQTSKSQSLDTPQGTSVSAHGRKTLSEMRA